MKLLAGYSNRTLLRELLARNPVTQGAFSRASNDQIRESTVGLDNDRSVTILINDSDLAMLTGEVTE